MAEVARLRLGLLVVGGVVLLLDLPTLLDDAQAYRPFWLEAAGYGLLAAATAAAVPFVLRHRPWGLWRWPLLIITFAGSTAATLAISPNSLFTTAHWAWDILGWWVVLFLLDRPLWSLLVVLAAHLGVTVLQLVALGRADRAALVGMAISGIALDGLPIAVRLFAAAAERASATAARISAETERARTAERAAAEIHHDRQIRYAGLDETAGPLLRRLAAGELDPGDPAVRHLFFVEAARLRRLFAESDDSADPLVHEVTACADTAVRRGIVVSVAVRGTCPPVPQPARRDVTDAVLQALAAAHSRARVTVVALPEEVTVTVVTDLPPGETQLAGLPAGLPARPPSGRAAREAAARHNVRVSWDPRGGRLWMEAGYLFPVPQPGTRPIEEAA